MAYMPNDAFASSVIAAAICGMGCYLLILEEWRPIRKKAKPTDQMSIDQFSGVKPRSQSNRSRSAKMFITSITVVTSAYLVSFLITNVIAISMAIACLASSIPYLVNKHRAESVRRQSELAWPETIDSLVSALQSGLGISDAVLGLADHAPINLRPSFVRIKSGVVRGETLENLFAKEKQLLKSAIADQVFETLNLAKQFGGRDSNNALRLLSEFIRDDLEVLEEIRTKFGWIKNSAALAIAAPWILLLLLSSQPSTVTAFSSGSGVSVLIAGVLMTAIAYMWMDKVGQLPTPSRALR